MKTHVLAIPLLTACISTEPIGEDGGELTSEDGKADAAASSWHEYLECNGGAAVVDVDSNERRNLQLVIHDPAARERFAYPWYLPCNLARQDEPCIGSNGEVVIRARTEHGVFAPHQFQWGVSIHHVAALGSHAGEPGSRLGRVSFYREGDGLRAVLYSDSYQYVDCGPTGEGPCDSWEVPTHYVRHHDWYFDHCY